MTTLDQLLQAIIDDPENDSLRLLYADLCEEAGDLNRANFIRWQIELVSLDHHAGRCNVTGICQRCNRFVKLDIDSLKVLQSHRAAWLPPNLHERDAVWGRGFVKHVQSKQSDWIKFGPELVKLQPITSVYLSDRESMFGRFVIDNGNSSGYNISYGGTGTYDWFDGKYYNYFSDGSNIDHRLFVSLLENSIGFEHKNAGGIGGEWHWLEFKTRERAVAELNRCALIYAKSPKYHTLTSK